MVCRTRLHGHGPDLAPGEAASERTTYGDVVRVDRLRAALARINPHVPTDALDEALRHLLNVGHDTPNLIENNRLGYSLESTDASPQRNRRPGDVIFVNGLPLGVIELKNAADENATIRGAFNQLQTYKREIPSLFPTNEILIIADGLEARAGTLTADWERFMPWRTIDGETISPKGSLELEVLIKGIFERSRFLDLIRYFVVFEVDGATIVKKMAGYHQYHAVNKAVARTVQAIGRATAERA